MHLKPYPVELVTAKVLNYDCMHSGQDIDKILAILFIPLAIDTIRTFLVFQRFFKLTRSNTHTHLTNRCTKGRDVFRIESYYFD